jgi:hypothetical protein
MTHKYIKNPSTADIIEFNALGKLYTLKGGDEGLFEADAANILLSTFGFLEESAPVETKKAGISSYKCPECPFTNENRMAVLGHIKTHGPSKGKIPVEILEEGEEEIKVDTSKLVEGKPAISEIQKKKMLLDQNQVDDIPADGITDKDGYKWVGEGVQEDTI